VAENNKGTRTDATFYAAPLAAESIAMSSTRSWRFVLFSYFEWTRMKDNDGEDVILMLML
jgi:hypothetical protein